MESNWCSSLINQLCIVSGAPPAGMPTNSLQQPPGRPGVNSVPQVGGRVPSSSPAPPPNQGPPHMLPPLNPHTLPTSFNQQQHGVIPHNQQSGVLNPPPVSSHIQPPSSTAQIQSQVATMSINGKQMPQPPSVSVLCIIYI